MNRLLKKIGRYSLTALARLQSGFDRAYLADDVPGAARQAWIDFLNQVKDRPGLRILEIGSREVTGPSNARERFTKALN